MKKPIFVLAVTAALAGCMNPNMIGSKVGETNPLAHATAHRSACVFPDDVTENNAHAAAAALEAEMNIDAQSVVKLPAR